MRVGVIGAGAVGGTLAALLARGGHDVEVTARGAHLAMIRADGIRLSGAWGNWVAHVGASEVLDTAPDLMVVATKAQDAAAALADNARCLDGIPVVVVQNGLDAIATARTVAPRAEVCGGLATFAASHLAPGEVTVTAPGRLFLGGATDEPSASLAARVFAAVLPTDLVGNFVGAQWTKLVINQINALPAITGMSAQDVVADRRLRRVMSLGMRETVRVGLESGIRFGTLQGLSHFHLRAFAAAPAWIGQLLPLALAFRMGSTPNPGSTLQSIRRGQATEIDYLNGAVVRAAAAIDFPVPVNDLLVRLVHEVEHAGVFLTPEDILAGMRRAR